MDKIITNIQADTVFEPDSRILSRIVVESTCALEPRIVPEGGSIRLVIPGVGLNLPDCRIGVHDGLVEELVVTSDGVGVCVEALTEHDAPISCSVSSGLPWRLDVRLDATAVYAVFAGRVLAIDPGHGGQDAGGRGPVNLRESDVVLDLGRRLRDACGRYGLRCFMTREDDSDPGACIKLARVRDYRADFLVSLHTGVFRDGSVRGAAAAFQNPEGERLARLILRRLTSRLCLPDRGVYAEASLPQQSLPEPGIPAASIEFVTITNFVDEGLVRSCTFMDRVALTILNGIKDYCWGRRTGT